MSESDEPSERDAIRQAKRERLKEKLADDAMAADAPVHVESRDHLQELVTENRVVLADFHADWCGPCKMLEPVVESIAASTEALVAKVDVDRHQALAQELNVRGVPTLVLYAGGQPVERLVGVQDEARLRSLITKHAS